MLCSWETKPSNLEQAMSGEFFTELLDFGALGLFAGFLVWLYVGDAKEDGCAC